MSRLLLFALSPLLFFNLLLPIIAGQSNRACISPGGRFHPFSFEGKPPRKAAKGPKDLTFCRVFRRSTCCDVTQTHPALLLIRRLASKGEANRECLDLWELLECSICDPRVGVRPGPPLICSSLCDRVLEACGNAYFSVDLKTQVLSPCGLNDILCGRASEWASNGTELCQLAGFSVKPDEISYKVITDEPLCYGGKVSLGSIADSWKPSQFKTSKSEKFTVDDFGQRVRKMPISEKVSWAVGGMVLTAGILFISKRKSYRRRQKQAAVYRAARRLEGKANHQFYVGKR